MSVLGGFAQLLIPTAYHQYKDAHHPTNVLLTQNHEFSYFQSVALEYDMKGLSFNYNTMKLTFCETRYPTPKEEKIHPAYEYPWHDKYEMKISKEQADALFSLFTSAVYSASYISNDGIVMDGCFCEFTVGRRSGYTNSPSSKSNCGRLLSITRKLFECVKRHDTTAIETMMNEIKSLTNIFVSYYPCEFPKDSYIYDIHKRNNVKGPSVGMKD